MGPHFIWKSRRTWFALYLATKGSLTKAYVRTTALDIPPYEKLATESVTTRVKDVDCPQVQIATPWYTSPTLPQNPFFGTKKRSQVLPEETAHNMPYALDDAADAGGIAAANVRT